jgi:predicted AlkP superfamily phosphohydrolase/phosphomutase
MKQGRLPNLSRLRASGGFADLGTSIPPQSPVAWANFINGAGPGSHGIFDFIHRHPEQQCDHQFYPVAETTEGEGGWQIGKHKVQVDYWPFNHKPPATVLRRQGEPFWDFLDEQGVPSTFYDLPSNYPPSPSQYGHHRCICGMGTPDMLGGFGTYQAFVTNPDKYADKPSGMHTGLAFENHTATTKLVRPKNSMRTVGEDEDIEFHIHRDLKANAAVIEFQGRRIILKAGQWSDWTKIDIPLSTPFYLDSHASGIVRFFLQEVSPNFCLHVSPINVDPSNPAVQISEPPTFITEVSARRGLFATIGFQEEYEACKNGLFTDNDYLRQAGMVLEERLALFEYAQNDYEGGLMYFYFSSCDLLSHMFWWRGKNEHPTRSGSEEEFHNHVKRLYHKIDEAVGEVINTYGDNATIIVMSDHGFANFGWQFNLNSWLRDNDYLGPEEANSLTKDVDWSRTGAYGLGINGLYLNLKGRERDGIVERGDRDELLKKLQSELLEWRYVDEKGREHKPISSVYRADQVYSGPAAALAPDLIIGYARNYRASWATCTGVLTPQVILANDSPWSADHCIDAKEVPGILFCNRPFHAKMPQLADLAPSILSLFGVSAPSSMTGRNIF